MERRQPMTKKDYELIAKAVNYAFRLGADLGLTEQHFAGYKAGVGQTRVLISKALAEENPLFDSKKFEEASGI